MSSDDELQARWAPTLSSHAGATHRHDWDAYLNDVVQRARAFGVARAQEAENLPFQSGNEAWEESVDQAVQSTGAPVHTGVMVAFYPSAEQQTQLALDDGEPVEDLHLTLAFLGEVGAELQESDQARLVEAVSGWAGTQEPITATTNGHGIFTSAVEKVTYATVDAPQLPAARQALVEALAAAGLPHSQTHGYVPHITLVYDERRDIHVPELSLRFDEVVIKFADQRTSLTLTGSPNAAPRQVAARQQIQIKDRPQHPTDMTGIPPLEPEPAKDGTKTFVTDIGGRTLITAPAATLAAFKDPTVEDIAAEHMLWMHGRFVGADVPNRNGAMWSAGDLEMAKGSVVNGPLNWLHEGRHVIGTLAKADYVQPTQAVGRSGSGAQFAATTQAHITATAAIWRWLYPDEAYVVQQASELNQLWYSMECISKQVTCSGESGCGNTTSYSDYMSGAACEHVVQRASIRRFVSPVFLGGAVIVPPTRPGWAAADAQVMKPAAALAEAAFEQAGRPDMSATAWEQVMAQLVLFAQG
jgi:2'-5' RNA ligase